MVHAEHIDVVEAAWRKFLMCDYVSAQLVEAAYTESRLRLLLPWVGM